MKTIGTAQTNKALDILKIICAILILGSHTLPLIDNNLFNFYFGQWFFRFSVPVFFISSGFFYEKMTTETKKKYIKRIFCLYLITSFIYLPRFIDYSLFDITQVLVFGYWHLWYLSALLYTLLIMFIVEHKLTFLKKYMNIITAVILLIAGAFFDEYYKLFNSDFLNTIAESIEMFGTTRHFMFMGLPLAIIGKNISSENKIFKVKVRWYILLLVSSLLISFIECYLLKSVLGNSITCDITLFNYIPAVWLFIITFYIELNIKNETSTFLRKVTDVIYIIHIWVVIICNILHITLLSRFVIVTVISISISYIYCSIAMKIKKRKILR